MIFFELADELLYLRNTTYIPEIGYREPVTFRVFDNENGDVYSLQFAFYFVQAPPLGNIFPHPLNEGFSGIQSISL